MACLAGAGFRGTLVACVGIVFLVTGCGPSRPKTAPVSGVVTLDGKPVAGASVMLTPDDGGRPALGESDAEGKFALATFEPGDGALVGKHHVTVRKVEISGVQADRDGLSGQPMRGGVREKWVIPKKYSNSKEWDHTVEVKSGMEPLKLELTSR
jgi:hypothetical protein